MSRLFLPLLALLPFSASAQDGGQLFTTYCAACHGGNGEGAGNGQFPPLAASPWLAGTQDRAIKIVLMGLEGPVEVNGRTWNLAMPPQGAAIPDDQIAAILTYVRSSWGNKADAVTPDHVKTVRTALGKRANPWTSPEILKLHPLDFKPPIKDLISYLYDGSWRDLPDFASLKPVATEEEQTGKISLKKIGKADNYGVVWQGTLEVPVDADYEFLLDCDDGGRLKLDGKTVADVPGIGPIGSRASQVVTALTSGPHPLRVEYYELSGNQDLRLAWRQKGAKSWIWLSDKTADSRSSPQIPIEPTGDRPAIYRNFIKGTSPRAICFGFPGGVNLAWSADHLAPELIWTGLFMDGGRHWTDRGQGNEAPAGDEVVTLTKTKSLPAAARFKGYQLDPAGNPTFAVQLASQRLLDSWKAGPLGAKPALIRTLSLVGPGDPLEITLSDQVPAILISGTDYSLGDQTLLHLSAGTIQTKGSASVLKLDPGQPVTITYGWK
jgi:mono/diheme cytochrome c family protein